MLKTVRAKRVQREKKTSDPHKKTNPGIVDAQDAKYIKFQDYYELVKPLGSGSFGDVYLIRDRVKDQMLAAKFETKEKVSRLYIEYKTYRRLHRHQTVSGIPQVYKFFQTNDYNVMLMDRLGYSLDDLFTENEKKLSLPTMFMVTRQILRLIEQIHRLGFIHRDIKPNNFMIGEGEKQDQIHLLDFGLSKKYRSGEKHLTFRKGRSLIGTARYASINMHMGFEPSRRDDLESIGYMLVYLMKGHLPWQGLRKKKGKVDIKKIGEIKICTKLSDLCKGLPSAYAKYLEYCRELKFDEEPNYELLHSYFEESIEELGITPNLDWKIPNKKEVNPLSMKTNLM